MSDIGNFWSGKRVLVTGSTGFKGSWLTTWLLNLGANVWGYALPPEKNGSIHEHIDNFFLTNGRPSVSFDSNYSDIRSLQVLCVMFPLRRRRKKPEKGGIISLGSAKRFKGNA